LNYLFIIFSNLIQNPMKLPIITKTIIISILILISISTNNGHNNNPSKAIINNMTLNPDQKYESLIPIRRAYQYYNYKYE
jgi:hypothetical protein